VAAGFCVAALGTDTLGSVRIPAAYCGVYGLKPGSGTVSQRGLELVAARFDTIGPLARSLDDLEAVANVIADLPPPRPVDRVATLDSLDDVQCDPAVAEAYRRGLSAVAAAGVPRGGSLKLDLKPIRLAGFVEAAQELGRTLENLRSRHPERFSDSLNFLLDYGARNTSDAALLEQVRHEVTAAVGSGVLLMPTAPQAAFVHGSRAPANQADFTALASIAGLPALSIPAGVDGKGMPVAVQLVGVRGNELGLINLARLLEPQLGGAIRPTIF
jgi:aspartyl-tRNA(Asn)/glutamyl-tRNA(Gln) amidotransferase subunit A